MWAAAPLAVLLWAWSIASVMSDGSAAPLMWLPLLNPLDLVQAVVFAPAALRFLRIHRLGVPIGA